MAAAETMEGVVIVGPVVERVAMERAVVERSVAEPAPVAQQQWSPSSQGRVLCQHYIIQRSIKAGAQLKRVRCMLENMSSCGVEEELLENFLDIIHIMEELNPKIYDSCSSKLKVTMSTGDQVRWTYENITTKLLKTGVNWGKLISIFTVCGALAADCVSQGHTDFLPVILDCFEESCSQPQLHTYLKSTNGWQGVVDHYDDIINGRGGVTGEDIARKSAELLRSLTKSIDSVSVAMICLIIVILSIAISKHLLRESKISPH